MFKSYGAVPALASALKTDLAACLFLNLTNILSVQSRKIGSQCDPRDTFNLHSAHCAKGTNA